MRRKIVLGIVAALGVLILIVPAFVANSACSPPNIETPGHEDQVITEEEEVTGEDDEVTSEEDRVVAYQQEVITEGVKSTFRGGVVCRHPGMVPLLEVSGDHYEMGLQYGVLLRPEILNFFQESWDVILHWNAELYAELSGKGDTYSYFGYEYMLESQAELDSKFLPQRFLEETRGIAEGSGVPFKDVLTWSMMYNLRYFMDFGCSSVLMRGADGTIIHGYNTDTDIYDGGEEFGKLYVVIRRNAVGYNSVTTIDPILFGGVLAGYNDKGLRLSHENYSVKEPNPTGIGFNNCYLVRIALEEYSSIDDVYPLHDRYSIAAGAGNVWSERDEGKGVVIGVTPTALAVTEMDGSWLWDFNCIRDPELRKQDLWPSGACRVRERKASAFPQKPVYEIRDAIEFLRAVSQWGTTRGVVFDPKGDGFYLAVGLHYASCEDIYHIHEDFSRPPELFMEADESCLNRGYSPCWLR